MKQPLVVGEKFGGHVPSASLAGWRGAKTPIAIKRSTQQILFQPGAILTAQVCVADREYDFDSATHTRTPAVRGNHRREMVIGDHNPDWGIVMEQRDQFGDRGETLYLVRETKGSTTMGDLYQSEQQKIHCGGRHFNGALDVNYRVVKSADELP